MLEFVELVEEAKRMKPERRGEEGVLRRRMCTPEGIWEMPGKFGGQVRA